MSSCVSIPALLPGFSQMISLKSNGKLWLVSSARPLTESFFPNVNILVSLLFSDSLIWWGKCPNKDKGTVNQFQSCRGKNVRALQVNASPLFFAFHLLLVPGNRQTGFRGYILILILFCQLVLIPSQGGFTSVECLFIWTGTVYEGILWKIVTEIVLFCHQLVH